MLPSLLYFEDEDEGVPEPGRGIADDGGGIAAVLAPSEDRFVWVYGLGPPGPVDRFKPVTPAVVEWAYRPADGTGRKVGVAGREVGVGIELVVVAVLRLPPDNRDWGRRIPVPMVL